MKLSRKIVGACFLILSFLLLLFSLLNPPVEIKKITYADGCIEVYHNNNLITPECLEGRIMQAAVLQRQKENNVWAYNVMNFNKSVMKQLNESIAKWN